MKIIACDVCYANVNNFSYWYGGTPRNMYELKLVHESESDTYDEMIICHKCIEKLLHKAELSDKELKDTTCYTGEVKYGN